MKWIFGQALMIFLVSGCAVQLPKAIVFPDRDIVFQVNDREEYSIGFVNEDGSAPVIFPTGEIRISQPTWSQDRETIFFRSVYNPIAMEIPYEGWIGYLRNEEKYPTLCNHSPANWEIYAIPGEETVLYNTSIELGILDLKKCKPKVILVDYSQDSREQIFITTPSLSRDHQYALFSEVFRDGGKFVYRIMRLDLQTKKVKHIGEGISAVLSPDIRQIAFVRPDGIYRMDFDGKNEKKLVEYRSIDYPEYEEATPIPYWSPDGEALVYHKCVRSTKCKSTRDFWIYLYSFIDGKEHKIFEGGLYPNWP